MIQCDVGGCRRKAYVIGHYHEHYVRNYCTHHWGFHRKFANNQDCKEGPEGFTYD